MATVRSILRWAMHWWAAPEAVPTVIPTGATFSVSGVQTAAFSESGVQTATISESGKMTATINAVN